METPKVSLIASANRPQLYKAFLDSLKNTSEDYEVVFVGNNTIRELSNHLGSIVDQYNESSTEVYPQFRYIHTANIKPAQCYEVARRVSLGELICWVADDCEFIADVIGKAYRFWKNLNERKAILSIQTKENYGSGYVLNDMEMHSFFGGRKDTPRMAPLGMMSREYLDELGGLDRRYICGQYENDIVMRIYSDGGSLHPFKKGYIEIDHLNKHGGVVNTKETRPFAAGYPHDRLVLETSWSNGHKVFSKRRDQLDPYIDENLLTKSQSFTKAKQWTD